MKTKLVRPILIESNIPTELVICAVDGHLHKTEHYGSAMESIIGKDTYQQLILISLEDEKIEVGDKIYHPNTGLVEVIEIERLISYSNYKFKTVDERCWICDLTNETKKVIATQSQLSPENLQSLIETYNKFGHFDDIMY